MFSKLPVLVLCGLAFFQGAHSQQTTATVFPGDPDEIAGLHGDIKGTGSDGTTYIISGTVSGLGVTATLVEGSTYLSEGFAVETAGAKGEFQEVCSLGPELQADCTGVVELEANGIKTAVTTHATASRITLSPVVLDTSAAPGSIVPFMTAICVAVIPLFSFGLVL